MQNSLLTSVLFALLIFGTAKTSHAITNGQELLRACRAASIGAGGGGMRLSEVEIAQGLSCTYYLQGMTDMNYAYAFILKQQGIQPFIFCTPPGYTNHQGINIVDRYLQRHPEKLHEPPMMLVIYAFTEAFPCDR